MKIEGEEGDSSAVIAENVFKVAFAEFQFATGLIDQIDNSDWSAVDGELFGHVAFKGGHTFDDRTIDLQRWTISITALTPEQRHGTAYLQKRAFLKNMNSARARLL